MLELKDDGWWVLDGEESLAFYTSKRAAELYIEINQYESFTV